MSWISKAFVDLFVLFVLWTCKDYASHDLKQVNYFSQDRWKLKAFPSAF